MMHFMFFGFLLFIKIIQALDYADFGLPNRNSCVFSHGEKIYIINQQSLAISFNHPWNNITSPQITTHNLTTVGACSITRSGKVILMPLEQQQPLQVLDDIALSWNLNSNITYLGSQYAIDLFIKRTIPLAKFVATAFNDFIMIFGGDNNNESSTFILDTRYATLYTWHEISFSTNTPTPISFSNILYTTSRWILHFQVDLNIIYIHCFDPLNLQWHGLISTIELSSNETQSIQVIPTSSFSLDSFLIITTQENGNKIITNLWQLNVSTLIPDITTVTLLNSIIQQSSQSGSGSVLVTRIDDEMALFYGGKDNLGLFNTTSKTFISTPEWLLEEVPLQQQENHLGIILGTVLGGVVFIVVFVILFIWLRKRSNVSLSPNNNATSKRWPFINKPGMEYCVCVCVCVLTFSIFLEEKIEQSPSISQFTLSPIKRLSPISLFPLPSDNVEAENEDEGITVLPQQPKIKSRFMEHFDYHDSIVPESLKLQTREQQSTSSA